MPFDESAPPAENSQQNQPPTEQAGPQQYAGEDEVQTRIGQPNPFEGNDQHSLHVHTPQEQTQGDTEEWGLKVTEETPPESTPEQPDTEHP